MNEISKNKKLVSTVFRFLFTIVGVGLGIVLVAFIKSMDFARDFNTTLINVASIFIIALFALIFFIISPKILKSIEVNLNGLSNELRKRTLSEISLGSVGLIVGLVIAFFVSQPLAQIPMLGTAMSLIIYGILGYLGINLALRYRDDITLKIKDVNIPRGVSLKEKDKKKNINSPKVLDTSVIIDGRIKEVCQAGFLEGTLIVSKYVLEELQHIADSSDALKRNRGRRGLDILKDLQDDSSLEVVILNDSYDSIKEVDSILIQITKDLKGKIVTNDYNLNKVAAVQNIQVLNINELANSVKPVYLPGEIMQIQIVKPGKEHGQGLGYLDDGTMIVVEGGKNYVGEDVEVIVTSALQTAAGKMIFAKPTKGE